MAKHLFWAAAKGTMEKLMRMRASCRTIMVAYRRVVDDNAALEEASSYTMRLEQAMVSFLE